MMVGKVALKRAGGYDPQLGKSVRDPSLDEHLQQQLREGEVTAEDITCPWCGYDGMYSGDVLGTEDSAEVECEACGEEFLIMRIVRVDFVSRQL